MGTAASCCGAGFTNWSGNLTNTATPAKPTDLKGIADLITASKAAKIPLRVVGAGHSQTPAVCGLNEKVQLVSLEKYKHLPADYSLDAKALTVTVNAGWTLGQLYDHLTKTNHFLENQTASSSFTIGGITAMPVHGGRLGAGIIADSIVGLTVVREDGKEVALTEKHDELQWYRANVGMFGVVTSLTLRVWHANGLMGEVRTMYNVFSTDGKGKWTFGTDSTDEFFTAAIVKCVAVARANRAGKAIAFSEKEPYVDHKHPPSLTSDEHDGFDFAKSVESPRGRVAFRAGVSTPEYIQTFTDYHNNALVALIWKDEKECADPTGLKKPDLVTVPKSRAVELFFKLADPNFRESATQLRLLSTATRIEVEQAVGEDLASNRNMFWVSLATRAYFMAYFIPVYRNRKLELANLYAAFAAVQTLVRRAADEKWAYNLDLPSDCRFVAGSPNAPLSPIAEASANDDDITIYACIDLACTAVGVDLNNPQAQTCSCNPCHPCSGRCGCNNLLNRDFRRFYYGVEQEWLKLGAKPHWGKMFGFASERGNPFDSTHLRSVFTPGAREYANKHVESTFTNNFVKTLLGRGNTPHPIPDGPPVHQPHVAVPSTPGSQIIPLLTPDVRPRVPHVFR